MYKIEIIFTVTKENVILAEVRRPAPAVPTYYQLNNIEEASKFTKDFLSGALED